MFHENFAKFAKNMILNARQKTSTFFIGYVNIRSCKVSYLWLYCAWKSSDGLFGIFRIKSEEIQHIPGVSAIIARFRLRMSIQKLHLTSLYREICSFFESETSCGRGKFKKYLKKNKFENQQKLAKIAFFNDLGLGCVGGVNILGRGG